MAITRVLAIWLAAMQERKRFHNAFDLVYTCHELVGLIPIKQFSTVTVQCLVFIPQSAGCSERQGVCF